ncbi:cutinase-domain-containing protein [Aspergillus varians]
MKAAVALTLIAGALSAPTPTLNDRQFDLGSLASLLPSGLPSGLPALPTGLFGGSSDSDSASGASATPSASSGGFDLGNLFGSSSGSSDSGSSSGLSGLSGLFGASGSNNDVTDNTGCKALTFIFARGTSELGTMGSIVGPQVASKLNSLTGNKVSVQGLDYPASAAGNADLGASGGPKMAALVEQSLKQCPDSKVVLGGYSQGAMVVHNAAGKLSSGQVVGAVTFGDPFKAQKPSTIANFKTFCASGDPVCINGANVMAHLSYGSDADEAAQFLVKAAGL